MRQCRLISAAVITLCILLWSESAVAQVASLSPTSLTYGNVALGSASSLNLKITNTGASNLIITAITVTGPYQSANCGSATITPNGSCTVSVTFTPTTTGSATGTLTITDNASNSPQVVNLSGNGVPAVSFSPPSLTFPNQAVGTASPAKNISIVNNQTVPLTNVSVTTTGNFTASGCPSTIAAQSSCVVSVTFTPPTTGTSTGSLVVNDSATSSPQSASLTGSGVQPVTLSPIGANFGNQVVNTTSNAKTLTLTNNQSVPLNIGSISASADFTAGSCATPIAAYSSCVVSVTFTPPTTGSISGTLTINDDATTSPQTASLSGFGVSSVSLSPTVLQFPSQVDGTTSVAKTITLSNFQSTVLNVTSVVASAPYSATTCPASIPPNGTCVISVTFTPTTVGTISGTLTVLDSASSGQQTATLQGTGAAVQLTSINVTPANPSVPAGTTQPFTATGNYNNGTSQNLTSATWTSSATSVATINSGGVATTLTAGQTTIAATSGSTTGSAVLTVTAPTLVSIVVAPVNPSITPGSMQQFTATGTYTNGTQSNITSSVSWSSSNLPVAAITSGGLASGLAPGSSTITATSGAASGMATLTVTPTVTSINVTPVNPSISAGSAQQLTATATFSDNSMQNVTNSAIWSTSNSATATVGASGLTTGAAQGTATISATYGTVTGNDTVTVTAPALVSIAVTPASPSLALNAPQQFAATGTFTDGSTQDLTSTGVTWSAGGVLSGNSTYGTVTASGLYTAPAAVPNPAQVTITAMSTANGSISGTSTATISQVTLSPIAAQVQATESQQFTATVSGISNQSFTWAVNGVAGGNSMVGTISAAGLYIAPATIPTPAQVTVTATSSLLGASASATVTVIPYISVSMSPTANQNVSFSSSKQFTATVTGSSNTAVTWSAGGLPGGNVIAGTITSAGLYTAPPVKPNPQELYVTATSVADPTKSASTIVTVVPPTGVSVAIAPWTSWVEIGQSTLFTASPFGAGNSSLTWSVNNVVGGNATVGTIVANGSYSALYTAPSVVPATPQVTVTVSVATQSASGILTIGATPFSATPLVDFTPSQLYVGQFSGMLYNGSNSAPPDQLAAGQAAASLVQPLDVNGNPDPNGKIVLIGVGQSEALDDWCGGDSACTGYSFMGQAAASTSVNHTTLAIVNGTYSGTNAPEWACPSGNCPITSSFSNQYDRVLNTILTPAGLTEAQVQVVWLQDCNSSPTWQYSLPSSLADAYGYEYHIGQVLRAIKIRWPNVQQVFLSSRIYAGYANTTLNPEPYAYEYGFAVKWLINAQIQQRATGVIDPVAGDLLTGVPWIDWGPYLWGNDSQNLPGSNALNWVVDDFTADGTHPSKLGSTQVGGALMNFFLNSPVTPWFTQ